MGHDRAARTILFERERRLHRSGFVTKWRLHNGSPQDGVTMTNINAHRIFYAFLIQWVVGFGHKTSRSLVALLLLIRIAWLPAKVAWDEGSFAPNSGPVLVSDGWLDLNARVANPAAVWSGETTQAGWTPPYEATDWQDLAVVEDLLEDLVLEKDYLLVEGGTGAKTTQRLAELDKMVKEALGHRARLQRNLRMVLNPHWESLFREGRAASRLGRQIMEFACIYTGRVSNFLHYPVDKFFARPVEVLPHERWALPEV